MNALDDMLSGKLSLAFTAEEWAVWMRQQGWDEPGRGVVAIVRAGCSWAVVPCDREAEILERQIWSGGAWQPGDRM